MATTVSNLHDIFTDRTGDKLVSSDYIRWPKATRYRLYTEACRMLVAEAELIRSTVTATITAAGIQGNNGKITFAGSSPTGAALNKSDVYRVKDCYWVGEKLEPVRKDYLDARYLDSTWRTATGTPDYWNLDTYGEGSVMLVPIPSADSGANGFRMDYIPLTAAFTGDNDTLPVSDAWAYAIVYLAIALAHEDETDPDIAAKQLYFMQKYEAEKRKALSLSKSQGFGQAIRTIPFPRI